MPRHRRFNPILKLRLNATGKITSWFVDTGMMLLHSYVRSIASARLGYISDHKKGAP
jgi:hypothetical protein